MLPDLGFPGEDVSLDHYECWHEWLIWMLPSIWVLAILYINQYLICATLFILCLQKGD